MPFYIRKSLSVGPVRFNLSKSGIGVSVGVRGLRLGSGARGNYVHAGRHGIYYRKTLPGKPIASATWFKDLTDAPGPSQTLSGSVDSPDHVALNLHQIESGNALQMVDSTSESLLRELNQKRKRQSIWPWLLGATCLVAYLVSLSVAPAWMWIAIALAGGLATLWRYEKDQVEHSVVLMYDIEEEAKAPLQMLCAVFEKLASAGAIWHVHAEPVIASGRLGHSFSSKMSRSRTSPAIGTGPTRLRTNIPVPKIAVGLQTLHFLPDHVLVEAPEGYGAVKYSNLTISLEQERVVEQDVPPSDARVVASMWKHVADSGERDGRTKHNRRLPVVMYERVHLKSASGLNELLHISVLGLGNELKQALVNMGAEPPTRERSQASTSALEQESAQRDKISAEQVIMPDNKSIREIFRQCIESEHVSGPERLIAELVTSETFTRAGFDRLMAEKGLAGLPELKGILLDLILLFANKCLEDHALSPAEIEELSFMVSVFRIDEGDFFKARRGELQELLGTQVKRILADRYVTEQEEILQRDLQRSFGLSYDQFVTLLRPQARDCIDELESRRTTVRGPEELRLLETSIQNLRSVFLISE